MQTHPIVHLEFTSPDSKAQGKFFSEVFGWKVEVDPKFDYRQFQAEGGPGGAFVTPMAELGNKAGDVIVYIGTADIDESLRKVEANGGKTLAPKNEIPGVGWFAFFTDPAGNRFALYTGLHP